MSIRYRWLKKSYKETVEEYDNRINMLPPFHAGYAYFGGNAYDEYHHIYGLYITWSGELNRYLFDPLSEYGFVIHCPVNEAVGFFKQGVAERIYVKLKSKKGRLYGDTFTMNANDKEYVVSYTGMCVNKPEYLCFSGMTNPDVPDLGSYLASSYYNGSFTAGSFNLSSFNAGTFNIGSFNLSSFNTGSFNLGSYNLSTFNSGSFNLSMFNTGSFNTGSFILSSFNIGSFNLGSFNLSSFNIGLFTFGSYNVGSFYLGSFYGGLFNFGSYLSGTFNIGSFNFGAFNFGTYNISSFNISSFNLGLFNTGSFNVGSYNIGSFNLGIFNTGSFNIGSYTLSSFNMGVYNTGSYISTSIAGDYDYGRLSPADYYDLRDYIMHEVYGIGCLGYGLNLI
ncbi:MAG: PPE family protein [Lachnospiraceae bacterium]|nr:PPE family protein [Lachnospiraceae bacterium]